MMTYPVAMIPTLLLTYGIKAEFIETRFNDFMEEDIFAVKNPKAINENLLGAFSDALGATSIVSFKADMITIEKSCDTMPHPFSAYQKTIKESKAKIPVFLGESMDGYEIADIKKDGNILICCSNVKARANILNTALSSIQLSSLNPQILMPETSEDFIEYINTKDEKQNETFIVIKDLPELLYSENGMEVEKLMYIKRNSKHLHFIAVSRYASAEIITKTIKKVFPVRITAQVPSDLNSRLILGTHGAEMLTGDYDYLLLKNKTVTHIYGARA